MAHGDERGLKLPPNVAPVQVKIIPIAQHKADVLEKAEELKRELAEQGIEIDIFKCDVSKREEAKQKACLFRTIT